MNFAEIQHKLSVYTENPCGSKRESFVFYKCQVFLLYVGLPLSEIRGFVYSFLRYFRSDLERLFQTHGGPHSRRDVLRKRSVGFIANATRRLDGDEKNTVVLTDGKGFTRIMGGTKGGNPNKTGPIHSHSALFLKVYCVKRRELGGFTRVLFVY